MSELTKEFDRQVENFIQKGYPEEAGISVSDFIKHIVPLKKKLQDSSIAGVQSKNDGQLPFVIVVKSELIPSEKMIALVEREGKKGFVNLHPSKPQDFTPIKNVQIPSGMVYLLVDIDRGKETLNVTPNEALKTIEKKKRSPLTIDEGIAIVTHYPEFLKKNNCFSMLASRAGDLKVPAIWISEGRPRLGWCWAGNPHTWLGSASCLHRV